MYKSEKQESKVLYLVKSSLIDSTSSFF